MALTGISRDATTHGVHLGVLGVRHSQQRIAGPAKLAKEWYLPIIGPRLSKETDTAASLKPEATLGYMPRYISLPNYMGRGMPEILQLNVFREYFDAIAEQRKRIEYRRRSAFWRKRRQEV